MRVEADDLEVDVDGAEERRVLKARVIRAQAKAAREEKTNAVNAAGGLLWGAIFVGAQYTVKEEVVPASTALGAIATLSVLIGVLSATGILGNWRGEDIEWREAQARRRAEERDELR